MSKTNPLRIAFIGCGRVSGLYGHCVSKRPRDLKIIGAFDEMPERASAFTAEYGGKVYPSLEALLNDKEVELVVNLTIHTVHAAITKRALLAGKHVHSEKPLATNRVDAREVVALARKKKLLLSCSPFVILGEAQQTLWKAVRDGRIGKVIAVNAEMFWGRPEWKHPNPIAFYSSGSGPMLDVGCYPLSILTSILGPVAEVRGLAKITLPQRVVFSGPHAGKKFRVTTPDTVFGLLTFANGVIGRITATFAPWRSTQAGLEIHGTKGSLFLSDAIEFNSEVRIAVYPHKEWKNIRLLRKPYKGVDWSRGLLDCARAIRKARPSSISGAQTFHILDVCLGILEASDLGRLIKIKSVF